MKKTFTLTLLSALLLGQSANAQGVKFGRRYMKQRVEAHKLADARQAAAAAVKETKALNMSAGGALDEYEEKVDDRIYRYVYAYDKDKMRSSETIYMKEKADGKWGAERLYTVGRYTYEYDTHGRLSVKTVTYDENDDFETYRVTVTYGDGITEYKKYGWSDSDGKYYLRQEWSYYDNGVLASFTEYSRYLDTRESTFDRNGLNTSLVFYSTKMTFDGEPNNQTVTYFYGDGWDDETGSYTSWVQDDQETYKYDAATGKLVEYIENRQYYDKRKVTYTYDALGRLLAIREYGEVGDDDDVPSIDVGGGTMDGSRSAGATPQAVTRADGDVEWELDYEELYTYFNDDVYGMGNSWHDVFGMDGPLARTDFTEYGVKRSDVYNRDADGKLTGIDFGTDADPGVDAKQTATINADGQIVNIKEESSYEDDKLSYTSVMSMDFTWTDGQIVKQVMTDSYEEQTPDGNYDYEVKTSSTYAYGDGKVTVKTYYDDSTEPATTTVVEEQGTTRKVRYSRHNGGTTENEYIARYVQTEDIAFVRPNLAADVDGMTADSTIVVSVAGRVVCAHEGEWNTQFGYVETDFDNMAYYANTMSGSTYFTVEHDGNETICSDIYGLPIYVLTDGRLTKEYKYYDVSYEGGGTQSPDENQPAMLAAAIPAGQPYDEITYVYDNDGRLTGKTVVEVDEDGTRTEEIKLEYVYNEASGVISVEASAQVGVTLNGRCIGLTDNSAFSVCTIGGQVLAAGVTQYTFAEPGIYVVTSGNVKTKVLVK